MPSKQYIWQQKMREQHRCVCCGQPATDSPTTQDGKSCYCEHHLIKKRLRGKKKPLDLNE